MLDAMGDLGAIPTGGDPSLEHVAAAARQSSQLLQQLAPFKPKDGRERAGGLRRQRCLSEGDHPFPRRLAGLASMIASGLPLRVVATSAPGTYDTHDNQANDLADNLRLTADSLLAFQRDLEARGIADRVLVHVWTSSAGGRRRTPRRGTDHGAAGTSFLIGTQVTGKQIGESPALDQLDRDENLRSSLDFRAIYGSILDEWLGADPQAIIPGLGSSLPRILR